MNGDGFDDLVVGSVLAGSNGFASGASYVVLGNSGGFSSDFDVEELNGRNGFTLSGEAAGDYSGYSAASAGDVNGDGFDDVIVAAQRADPNGTSSGASYVVFGKAGGSRANLNVSILNGANGFRFSGEAAATSDRPGVVAEFGAGLEAIGPGLAVYSVADKRGRYHALDRAYRLGVSLPSAPLAAPRRRTSVSTFVDTTAFSACGREAPHGPSVQFRRPFSSTLRRAPRSTHCRGRRV
ncbi:MAG: VCBS repeat-containing protein [Pseudomonadota bacterium]|nr:VCBS repeat-containing protein [Pseudomonadota bacterium]